MKRTFLTIIITCAVTGVWAQLRKPAIPRDEKLEAKVEKTLSKMSLDEKIGQMLELNLDVMGKMTVENAKVDRDKVRSVLQQYGRSTKDIEDLLKMTDEQIIERLGSFPVDIYKGETRRVWKLNENMLDTLISKWKVGSILNAPGTRAPSVEQWQQWIGVIQEKSMKYLGIPDIYGLDHNHGVTYTQGGTLFPQPINIGATFNTELAKTGAEITAYESRAGNCPWVYNPVVDLSRDRVSGRASARTLLSMLGWWKLKSRVIRVMIPTISTSIMWEPVRSIILPMVLHGRARTVHLLISHRR